jgi:hypothetical protein
MEFGYFTLSDNNYEASKAVYLQQYIKILLYWLCLMR